MAKNEKVQAPQVTAKPVEIEDVRIERLANEKWRVVVAKYAKVPQTEQVLEPGVSLPVARAAAMAWRARKGGLSWGLP
jgi:hypothetical protein